VTATPPIDWDRVTEEAAGLLADYLRIDTTNPPGNETRATDWLGTLLTAEGIPYRTVARDPARASLAATLRGDGSRGRALTLLSHTDVVPAESDHWREEPLSGAIRDGEIWGRGAIDMKGMGVMQLMVLLLHHRLQLPLRRDLTLLAVADEEAGGGEGIEFLAREHPDLLRCDFVINEGGIGAHETFGVRRPVFNVGVAEKGPLWLRLVTTGVPGHGSVPHADNALERLVRALEQLQRWERPFERTPEVALYFDRLYESGVLPEPPTEASLRALAAQHPRVLSLQTNSVTATTLRAGVKHNVIPAQAEATLDIRLVPGYDPARFIEQVRAVIDDPQVRIETVFEGSTPVSPIGTELYRAIERAVHDVMEDAAVVPSVSTGFTDSRAFRRLGIPAYGFIPVLLEPDASAGMHGNDERLAIEQLRLGMQILFATVRRVCG
jgi:acetylornithine deacetylase/succinyl-diaminopimelate desuccinylase-like protein